MELGERNFKEQMKIIKEAGRLDGFTLRFFWTQMLQCVNVIHDLSKFGFGLSDSVLFAFRHSPCRFEAGQFRPG